jgi:hypothetical protein
MDITTIPDHAWRTADMTVAASMFNDIRRWILGAVVAVAVVGVSTCGADPFDKLPESIDGTAKELAVVFDFDTDSCYPSPAVSRTGKQNGGLKASGPITGQCRGREQLTNSNTYYRKKCMSKESVTYCVHMYALYFMKDQSGRYPPRGHRHDWEFALLWTSNGELTHASYSAHGKVVTKPTAELHFDSGVVVYEGNDYAGHSQVLDVGRYDVGKLSIGNDRISSVKVPSGWKVTLYQEAGFWGATKALTADTRALPDFNNRTSSILVERLKENTVKIVYHKDGQSTHAFRFAKKGEMAENDFKRWITPTLVDWQTMRSDNITNQELRQKFNQFNYSPAICPFNDTNFEREITKKPPGGYPF